MEISDEIVLSAMTEAQDQFLFGIWIDLVVPDVGETWWSAGLYEIFGLPAEDGPPDEETVLSLVHPDDRDQLAVAIDRLRAGAADLDVAYRLVRSDDSLRFIHSRGRLIPSQGGRPARITGTTVDMTEETVARRLFEEAQTTLAKSEERHRLLAENAYDVIWTMSPEGAVTYVSPSVERVRGITPAEAMAQTLDEIHPPESAGRVVDYYARLGAAIAAGTELPTFHGEQEYYRKDGSIMFGELTVMPQIDADGALVQVLGVTRDISERRRFEEELSLLALTDPLTGIWNRRQGQGLMEADLAEARRYGPALSVLMLDIDHFKAINDEHGHQVGDQVLIELTQRISQNLRTSDMMARWGGEEFVIMMRHCTISDALPLAEKIRELVADSPFASIGTVTVSIGAAQLGVEDDLNSWLARADEALYAAKAAGRNTVRCGD